MPSEIFIFNQQNKEIYQDLLLKFDLNLDIYYSAHFLIAEATMQRGEFEIFTVVDSYNEYIFIYPYIILPLEGIHSEYFDITSPYGYCGPYCNDEEFFDLAEGLFTDYAIKKHFVSELVRYHYLYNEKIQFKLNILNSRNRNMVVLELSNDWENIWSKETSRTNRNIVRKLEKEGYRWGQEWNKKHLEEFIAMYYETMEKAGAHEFYFFKEEYYNSLFESLKHGIFLARVTKGNETFASAIFFQSGNILTYFLSSRNLQSGNIPATNMLITYAAKYGVESGMKILNLGGGRTISPDDSLYKFKTNFSKGRKEFTIGKRIHNLHVYESIKEEYIKKYGIEHYRKVSHLLHFHRE